jgi:hypothetical protein
VRDTSAADNGSIGGAVAGSGVRPTEDGAIRAGTWVEVQQVVLPAGSRAPNVPDDTSRVDFVARIRGFLLADSALGREATVRTLADREVTGRLTAVNPRNPADFGDPVPELLELGLRARRALDEGEQG